MRSPAWFTGAVAFLGRPIRLPGWAMFILGAYSFIPDTASRLEFWGQFKLPSIVTSFLASPWAGLILITAATAWLWLFRGVVHVHHHHKSVQLVGAEAKATTATITVQDTPLPLRAAAASAEPTRDTWVQDAMMFALNGKWPLPDDKLRGAQADQAMKVLQKMRELAGEGRMTIWGKETDLHLPVQISADFWVENQINYMTAVFEDPDKADTESATAFQTHKSYKSLQVSRQQIEALWPTA
jgi:hypothetical protein